MPDISIIIPIYNSEKYLQKCLDCFWVDTRLEVEIIAIDDCSSDSSPAILEHNRKLHPNLRIVRNEKNMNVSAVRNLGLGLANGKYIFFCDSDDTLDFKGLETLFNMAEEQDLDVALGYRWELLENTGKERRQKLGVQDTGIVSGKDFFYISMTDRLQGIGPWQNLYRKDFMMENKLFYIENNLHEDNELMPRVMLAAKRVRSIDLPFYCHLIREGARSTSLRHDHEVRSRLEIMRGLSGLISVHQDDLRMITALRNMLAFNLAHLIRHAAMLPHRKRKLAFEEVRAGRYVLEAIHSTRRRARTFALCFRLSPEATCVAYSAYRFLFRKRQPV